jgi:hypothetical protein
MIVDGILILYTSTPTSQQMLALVQQMKAAGREVFLKPISQLELKKKPVVTPALQASLSALHPN